MAEELIINASASALATGNETTAAWTVAESVNAPSDTELRQIADSNGCAVMQTTATTAEQAAVAFCILDSLLGSTVDLSTAQKRKAYRLKSGLQEFVDIMGKIKDIA